MIKMVKKYLIAGGPCSGKTSVLIALEMAGEEVVRESSEDFIRLQNARGISHPYNLPGFQDELLNIQIARELKLESRASARGFVDGGIPDFFVYYPLQGLSAPESRIMSFLQEHPYDKRVFFSPTVKDYQRTRVRRESLQQARAIEKALYGVYAGMGYDLVMLVGDVDSRVKQILEGVEENDG